MYRGDCILAPTLNFLFFVNRTNIYLQLFDTLSYSISVVHVPTAHKNDPLSLLQREITSTINNTTCINYCAVAVWLLCIDNYCEQFEYESASPNHLTW